VAKLGDVKVRNLRQPGRYGDGLGLYLNVSPGGSKSWVQRIVIDGRRRDLGLGGYPTVGLAEAREKAMANRRAVREGRSPVSGMVGRRNSSNTETASSQIVPTFSEAAALVHAQNGDRWESPKTKNNWWQRAELYVLPSLEDMPVDKVGREQVLSILEPVWTTKPETARRIRLIIKTVMAWAMAHGHVEVNPAGEIIDAALPPMPKVKAHFRALPYAEVAGAVEAVEASTSMPSTKRAFQFLVLTAARSGEVRGATWREMDLEKALWTISASRMKGRREHRVP
jgi:hypothetical protein